MIEFACLGSGSAGNGWLVRCTSSVVLVDCGFGLRQAEARLARLGVAADELTAILVTHEHADHIGGVAALARRHGVQVLCSHGTSLTLGERDGLSWREIGEDAFDLAGLQVIPYTVPHDARQPLQYCFSDGNRRLGILTDAGGITARMLDVLSGVDALVLESNHETQMLAHCTYPSWLKSRIASAWGHLSNAQAAEFLSRLDVSRLQHMVAAHLSAQNNSPEHARAGLCKVLRCEPAWIAVADQEQGLGWREVR